MTDEPVLHFWGWARTSPRVRWRFICRAETSEACWDELHRQVGIGPDKLVRKGNANPNEFKVR